MERGARPAAGTGAAVRPTALPRPRQACAARSPGLPARDPRARPGRRRLGSLGCSLPAARRCQELRREDRGRRAFALSCQPLPVGQTSAAGGRSKPKFRVPGTGRLGGAGKEDRERRSSRRRAGCNLCVPCCRSASPGA